MRDCLRAGISAVAVFGLISTHVASANAAGALAVGACAAYGYANAPKLGQAQNTALQHCYKYGGKDCVIRAFICDGKKS